MKNQKMKKIMCEMAAIMLVILIMVVNSQAETNKKLIGYENNPEPLYCYFVIGAGFICRMTINGDEDKIGKLKGTVYIENEPGWSPPVDYQLFIFDKKTNKVLNKNSLHIEFTLQGFVGFGFMTYEQIPHMHTGTKFFIMGKAIDLIK